MTSTKKRICEKRLPWRSARCQTRTSYTRIWMSKPKNDILRHREKKKLPSFKSSLFHLLNLPPLQSTEVLCESFTFLIPRCYTSWQRQCVPAPASSFISCRPTTAVPPLSPTPSRERGRRAGSFITATPVSPLQVSTSFSSKWPWNQLHNRGLWNPKQQGHPSTELLHETKHLKTPNLSRTPQGSCQFLPAQCLLGPDWFQRAPTRGSFFQIISFHTLISSRECYPLSLEAANQLPGQQFWLSTPYQVTLQASHQYTANGQLVWILPISTQIL